MTIKKITTVLGARANFLSVNHWKATLASKLTLVGSLLCFSKDLNASRSARMLLSLKSQPEPMQLKFPWKALG